MSHPPNPPSERGATHAEEVRNLLDVLDRVEDELDTLADDIEELTETGLADEDLVILLWGRQHDRTKTGTRESLEALREVGRKDTREVMVRLVAAYGNMSLSDAEEFVADLYDLRDRYPSPESR